MEIQELKLTGAKLVIPQVFRDERGFFLESYRRQRYHDAGIDDDFVQDNHSRSVQGTLRGMHLQTRPGQAKLVRVTRGRIFDVIVDVRPESPTFRAWHGVYLDDENFHQLYVPVGFAHGFCVLSDVAEVEYKVSAPYDAATERGFRYDDADVNIEWPIDAPVLSKRDRDAGSLQALLPELG